ncbi:alpha/beta fold hydrolase [Leptolyngbya ohadii]|uniref:alpha/beta fold hydrolase n=1 Tax=Leptolyngbya ohadii TaxID=1962290 RepID=UPI000B59A38E|nr:alpha/beta fold hydrolase [Leptolyngbya ohadii]
MQMPPDQYISVNGIRTRYWSVGEAGSPVLLIHGAGGSADYWYRNIFSLAQQHQVYALDWVGSGKSDKPEATYTYEDLTQFALAFMDAVGLSSANVVGTSAGGILAMKLASQFPDRIQKLVLSGSAGLGKALGLGMRLSTIPGIGEALNRPSRATAKFLIRQCAYRPETFLTDDFVDLVERNLPLQVLQFQLRTFRTAANFSGMKSDFLAQIRNSLPKIKASTLVLWGKQDQVTSVSGAEIAANEIPDAKLHLFDNCGHWAYLEHTEEFNQLVLEFLKD